MKEAALANGLDPRKAVEQLPQLYRLLSEPMHKVELHEAHNAETPIDAILHGDPTALLLVSCLFKMTRRELRLYRSRWGGRESVQLILKEPGVPPLK